MSRGLPNEVLNPRQAWQDPSAYDTAAKDLVTRFQKNFEKFREGVTADVREAEIKSAA